MNEDRETVCAVVVTYNRKKLLLECLEAIRRQTRPVQGIYIIDNASTDGTPEFLKENGYINELPPENLAEPWEKEFTIENLVDGQEIKIHYVRMHENTGGAGGFHEGVKRAYEKGYDWLWLMDDDVEPLPDGLSKQLQYKCISLLIHPSKVYPDGEIYAWEGYLDEGSGYVLQKKKEEFRFEKTWTCTNIGCFEGMLVHRYVVSKIGYPLKQLFFIGDDTYFGYLASKVTNVIYIRDICFVKKIKPSTNLNPIKVYLVYRNIIGYLARIISKDKRRYYVFTFSIVFYNLLKYMIRLEFGMLYFMLRGFLDGLREKWGYEKILMSRHKKM